MKIIFDVKNLPVLQNRVYTDRISAISSETGDVSLAQDPDTGIVMNRLFDDLKIVYDENYDNEQSISASFLDHLNVVADILHKYLEDKNILEIGCGKGFFLELLRKRGYNVIGVDPTYEGNAEYVLKKFFSPGINVSGEIIILRHVLEHIKNPVDFLRNVASANSNSGLIYIEVPDFNWITKNNAWYDVFYEHVNYFTPSDFRKVFSRIIESGPLFSGQYQYVIADLSSIAKEVKFQEKNVNISLDSLLSLSEALAKQKSAKIAIWGAASKGVISALHLTNAGVAIDYLVDINPNKINKYAPITGIKIISADNLMQIFSKEDIVVIANPNYENEIKKMTENKFVYINL